MRMPRIDIVGGASTTADGGAAISRAGQCGSVMGRVKLSKQNASNSKPRYVPPSLRKETAPKNAPLTTTRARTQQLQPLQQRQQPRRAVHSNQPMQNRVGQHRVQILARAHRSQRPMHQRPSASQQRLQFVQAQQQQNGPKTSVLLTMALLHS